MDRNHRLSGPGDLSAGVAAVLAAVAGTLTRLPQTTLAVYLEEILRWNCQLGVVSKRDTPAVLARLVEQSVRLWDFVVETVGGERATVMEPAATLRDVIDIGSGAGFPGVVWKMLVPDVRVTLIERREKKVAFLERAIARTGLDHLSAEAADVRDLVRRESRRASADLVVMMAVGDPADFADPVVRLLRTPGFFCCVRAREQAFDRGRIAPRLECSRWVDTEYGRFVLYRTTQDE